MKKILLAATMLSGFAVAANAADLRTTSPAAVPAVAPMAGNWSGFYVGMHAGWTGIDGRVLNTGTPGALSSTTNRSSLNWGFLAGANFQMQQLVLGLEADIGFPGHRIANDAFANTDGAGVTLSQRYGMDWNAHIRARAGLAMGQFMPFIAAGLSLGQERFANIAMTGDRTRTAVGYTLGVGADFMFTRNWIGRIEYIYDDFGARSAFAAVAPGVGTLSTRPTANTVRAAIMYKF